MSKPLNFSDNQRVRLQANDDLPVTDDQREWLGLTDDLPEFDAFMDNLFSPDEVPQHAPGEFLQTLMRDNGWDIATLAAEMGMKTPFMIEGILTGTFPPDKISDAFISRLAELAGFSENVLRLMINREPVPHVHELSEKQEALLREVEKLLFEIFDQRHIERDALLFNQKRQRKFEAVIDRVGGLTAIWREEIKQTRELIHHAGHQPNHARKSLVQALEKSIARRKEELAYLEEISAGLLNNRRIDSLKLLDNREMLERIIEYIRMEKETQQV